MEDFNLFKKKVNILDGNREGIVVGFHQYEGDEMSYAVDPVDDRKNSMWLKRNEFEVID